MQGNTEWATGTVKGEETSTIDAQRKKAIEAAQLINFFRLTKNSVLLDAKT